MMQDAKWKIYFDFEMVTLIKFTIQLAYFSCSNLGAMCILYNLNYAFIGTKGLSGLINNADERVSSYC